MNYCDITTLAAYDGKTIPPQTYTFTVEAAVPIPPPKSGSTKYPFPIMQVGDSFFVPNVRRENFCSCIANARFKNPGTNFTTRRVTENGVKGVRVWRIA
jgi:hypothetical protein